jgi:uncharacterized protein with FMN-binding domain
VKPRVVVGASLASLAVLAVGWFVGTPASTGSSTASGSFTNGTFTGSTEQTRYGDVQVSVTISGGRITEVTALHLTDAEQRSVDISNQAAPILRAEVLKAQSASVATVAGATFTTEGYLASLQSALDKAKA